MTAGSVFPPNHPSMTSFLGVPILAGAQILGQIYLTDKEDYFEFTQDDERVIETLATYAAVAIGNARLYEDLLTRDKAVTQRNRDLALLNAVGEMLAEHAQRRRDPAKNPGADHGIPAGGSRGNLFSQPKTANR